MSFRITTGNTKPQILQDIKLDDKTKQQLEDAGVMFSTTKTNLSGIEDLLKPVKEETVKNSDGTTSTVKTYRDGRTSTTTAKKDENGIEYTETIDKGADGTVYTETISYPGKSRNSKIYDKNGNLKTVLNQTYQEDGKTIKSESQINYDGKDNNGNPKIAYERHTYENGNKSEILYDEQGKPTTATINTKEGKNAVELSFDLKDSQLEAGNVKLDEQGWPITTDGKFPKIAKKITNSGLPTSTTSEYKYNEDGSITEYTYYTEGSSTTNILTFKDIESLRKGVSNLDEALKDLDLSKLKLKPKEEQNSQSAEKPAEETPTAPKETPAQQEEQPQYTEYKIKRGDTLSAIAKKYGTTVEELARINNIKNPNMIIAGKTIKIPNSGATSEIQDNKPADNVKPKTDANGNKTETLPGGTVITTKNGRVVDVKYPEGDKTTEDEMSGSKTVWKNGNPIRTIEKDGTVHIYAKIYKPGIGKVNMSIMTIRPDGTFTKSDYNDAIEQSEANGKLDGNFAQGNTGDCWLLAGIDAITRKPGGRAYLEKLIKVDRNTGNVTVRLPGAGKTYTITADELKNANHLSNGDMDFRAFEIAMDKYMKETGNYDNLDENGTSISLDHTTKLFEAIFGKTAQDDISSREFWFNTNKFNNSKKAYTILTNRNASTPKFTTSDGKSGVLEDGHAYSVIKSDGKFIYLVDPHNSKEVLKVSVKEFHNHELFIQSVTIK